ncbi:MAG: signal peptidase I [Clostridiales bacterium]|nr:signal peptidase I [Clostridiales bacterium]
MLKQKETSKIEEEDKEREEAAVNPKEEGKEEQEEAEEIEETEENRKGRKKKKKKTVRKKTLKEELTEDLILFAIVLITVFCIQNFVIVNAVIPSGSMEDTILIGDRIIGNRLAYRFGEPERGDIVIFKYPDNEEQVYIKRLIGLPGEKVELRNGLVYINDSEEPLEEPYLPDGPSPDYGVFYVPEDGYFMMGDNRYNSVDSREWEHTFVTRDQVLAKAFLRYYPLNRIKLM